MASDVKKEIAEAARTLLEEKGVKKLTVKDIVEECHITRQTFYYYFENIPELFRWILEEKTEELMRAGFGSGDPEEELRYFFLMAINARGDFQKVMESNYGDELQALLKQHIYQVMERIADEKNLFQDCSRFRMKWILRYHCSAMLGILKEWSDEDTKNLDQIVHEIYLLITGRMPALT